MFEKMAVQQWNTPRGNLRCDICEKDFSCNSTLTRHMRIHSDNKIFKCPFCSYSGHRKDNLGSHMKSHSLVKSYSCSLCPYSTNFSVSMKKHMKTNHPFNEDDFFRSSDVNLPNAEFSEFEETSDFTPVQSSVKFSDFL